MPAPEVDPGEARLELARRFLRVFGPASADSFSSWAGVRSAAAAKTFDDLRKELVEVMTLLVKSGFSNLMSMPSCPNCKLSRRVSFQAETATTSSRATTVNFSF